MKGLEKMSKITKDSKLIYVASPYAGDIEKNVEFAKSACRAVVRAGHVFYAPHLMLPSLYSDDIPDERQISLDIGLYMIPKCDELWVFGTRISRGMKGEIEEANRLGIPVRQVDLDLNEIIENED